MARGWESKSVESQVDQFQVTKDQKQKRKITPEEAEKVRHKEVLMLAQSRLKQDLESCQDPAYRQQLRRALDHIESQLAAANS